MHSSTMPSAYDYTPNSYSSTLFDTRAQPNGLYHYVTNLITEMGPLAFANTTAGIDYVRSAQPGDRSYGFVGKDSRTFTTNIFGEILGSKYGTFTTARYNHYPGGDKQNPTPLGDRSKPAKAVFALGCPTQAPDVLADIWYNQLVSANDLRKYEAVWEREISQAMAANGEQAPSFSVKEFVKNICHPDDPRVEPDCIILTGPGMYMVPPQGVQLPRHGGAVNSVTHGNSTTRERMKRRRLDDTSTTSKVEPTAEVSTTSSSTSLRSTTRNGVIYPTDDQVFVGATYDPKLQLDYGGKNFAQVNARLVQPDFRDVHQKLICPWEFYDKLRPGTLVMANVNFAVYVMDGRKIYHANILSLRVLGVSDLPVDPPQRPRFGVVTASGPSGDSFKNFVVPNFSPPSPNHQAASSSAVSPPLASGLGEQAGESAQADTSSISPTGSASSGTLDGSDSSVDFNSRMKAIDVSDLAELEGDVDMNGVDGGDYEVVDDRVEQSKSKSRKQKRNH